MPPRRHSKRRRKATPPRRKKATRSKTGKQKRTSTRTPNAASAKRSAASKRAWATRKKKQKLIEFLKGWREVALPTKFDLQTMMEWAAEELGFPVSEMYRWYWGSEDAPSAEAAE